MLWAAQAPPNGSFWPDLAGPFFVAGIGTAFTFIPISIGALTGVTERYAGVASGLLSTSQNLGGAIGVAVASSIAASRFHTLIHHGHATAAALTGGFQLALWVCGLTGLAAVPVVFGLIRRHQKAATVAAAQPREPVTSAAFGESGGQAGAHGAGARLCCAFRSRARRTGLNGPGCAR